MVRSNCGDSKLHFFVHKASLRGRQEEGNGSEPSPSAILWRHSVAPELLWRHSVAGRVHTPKKKTSDAHAPKKGKRNYRSRGGFTEGRSPKSGMIAGEIAMIEISSEIPRSSCGSLPRA